jgi:hypothetical protein
MFKVNTTKNVPEFERPKIEEGLYTATLEEIQEFESEYGKGLRLIYKVEGQDNVKVTHLCSIPKETHPETKLGRILIAHGLELDGEVDIESIIGTKAKIMVEDVKKKDSDGKEIVFSGVSKVKKIE